MGLEFTKLNLHLNYCKKKLGLDKSFSEKDLDDLNIFNHLANVEAFNFNLHEADWNFNVNSNNEGLWFDSLLAFNGYEFWKIFNWSFEHKCNYA